MQPSRIFRGLIVFLVGAFACLGAQLAQATGQYEKELIPVKLGEKYRYCVVRHEGLGPRCQSCWTYVGGEGGRVACGYSLGPGSVHYGYCEEERNRSVCR